MWGEAKATPAERPDHRQPVPAGIQLLRYSPSCGTARAVGAVWGDENRLRWASPLSRRFEGVFNPLPFMLSFPDAQPECALFEQGTDWLDAECFAASDPQQVRAACERYPEWRLTCQAYPGTVQGLDLSAQLAVAPDWGQLRSEHLRFAASESVARLTRHHPSLRDTPFELVHDDTMEVGRLHLTEGRRVRIVVHPHGGRSDATALALMADDHLHSRGGPCDTVLLVLAQFAAPRSVRVTRRVAVVGLEFGVIARALIDARLALGR